MSDDGATNPETDTEDTDGESDSPGNPEAVVDAATGGDDGGVDYAWVMQTTFVVTILVGVPVVSLLSIPVALPTWNARAEFAVRVGAVVWFLTAVGVHLYASRRR